MQGAAVHFLGLDALHPRLDRVERLGAVDGDEPCHGADAKGSHAAQLLPGRHVALGQLLERGVGPEADSRVGGLAGRGGHEPLKESGDALFAEDQGRTVEEALHSFWVFGVFVTHPDTII